jgi:mannose-6-phosphate isomerase-like protein (cupin superfamily)
MIIPFNEIDAKVIPNFLGGEKEISLRMFKDECNKILIGTLPAGGSVGLHTHDTSSEIFYIIAGTGKVLYDGEYEPVSKGVCHYCPKGHAHSLINDGSSELVFFAMVPEQ